MHQRKKKLSINLTKEMHREVMKRGGAEFIRDAIKKVLAEECQETKAQ